MLTPESTGLPFTLDGLGRVVRIYGWSFVLAALRIDIPMVLTDLCVSNVKKVEEQSAALKDVRIVHYCHGDEVFNKRNYMSEEGALKAVWKTCAPEGTVNGAITQAIREAAVFFELA